MCLDRFGLFEATKCQLKNTKNARGCPSWMETIVTQRLDIDWNNIVLLMLAKGNRAALGLKLTTAFKVNKHSSRRIDRTTKESGEMGLSQVSQGLQFEQFIA